MQGRESGGYLPYKIISKSVLSVLIVFGLSSVLLTLKYEVAFAWKSRSSYEQRIFSLVGQNKLQEAMAETDKYLNKYKKKDNCIAWGYNTKGVIFRQMYEYTKAIYSYQEALKYIDVKDRTNKSILLENIGGLQHSLGDYTDAISYLGKSMQLMDNYDPRRYQNEIYVAWSTFYLSKGRNTTILEQVYERIKPRLHEIEDHLGRHNNGQAYSVASLIAFQLGRFDEAIQFDSTVLNIHNTDSNRLNLSIDLLYIKKEVDANEVFRRVLWGNVKKDSLALWYWLKGDEMLARRYLEECFAEECSSDIARDNLRGVIRRDEILPNDMWKEARNLKWFRELIYPNTLDYSTDKYAEQPEQETQEGRGISINKSQEKVLKDSPTNVFATNASNVFHKRDCSKLNASEGLIKFDTPQKASKAGGLPCNYCKP